MSELRGTHLMQSWVPLSLVHHVKVVQRLDRRDMDARERKVFVYGLQLVQACQGGAGSRGWVVDMAKAADTVSGRA